MEGRTANPSRRWPAWANATALLVAGWIALVILTLQVRPGATIVAVVFPPWWSEQQAIQAIAAANAAFVRTTAIPAILVVRPDDHAGLNRLREAGAWFAIDPRAIAACLTPEG